MRIKPVEQMGSSKIPWSSGRMHHVFSATITISLINVFGQIIVFFVQVITASLFGARAEMDAYVVAQTLPSYATSVLVSGLGFVFVPLFLDYRVRRDENEAWKLASGIAILVGLALGVVALIGMIMAEPLLRLTAPGLTGSALSLAASLAKIIWPGVLFSGLIALWISLYHANQRFTLPALIPLLGAAANLCLIAALGQTVGIHILAVGFLISSIVQCALLSPILRRRFSWHLNVSDSGTRELLRLLLPLMVGTIFAEGAKLIERFIASGLPEGSIAHLAYAGKLTLALAALLSSGIAVTFFPSMAAQTAGRDMAALQSTLSVGIRLMCLLVAPVISLGICLAHPLIATLFERGAFSTHDTAAVAALLPWYFLALIGMAGGGITARVFYALKDTRTMSFIAVVEVALYAAYALIFARKFGILGMAVSFMIYWNLSFLIQCAILWLRLRLSGLRSFGFALARIGSSALLAGAAASLGVRLLDKTPGVDLLCGGTCGIIAYLLSLHIARSQELDICQETLRRWVFGRLGWRGAQ